MGIGTRSRTRNGGSEANLSASTSNDITTPPPKRTPAAKARLPTVREAEPPRGIKDLGSPPKNVDTIPAQTNKRRFIDIEGSDDEDIGTQSTNTTSLRGRKTNIVASPISNNSNDSKKIATRMISSVDVKKMEFVGLEDMASMDFINVLASKEIGARKIEKGGFSKLEVGDSKHQTKVCWKSIPGSKHSSVKIPDTAKFGECSVFAIEASTKNSFEEKAEIFMSENMGSKTLERSMALVLHHDSDGKPQSAIVGYPMGGSLHYCGSLKAETANKIVMELNGGEHSARWHLEIRRKAQLKRRRLVGKVDKVSAQGDSDTSSD